MKNSIPSLFVSYGLPTMALLDDPFNSSLVNFGRSLGDKVKGIVCVSSQWVTPGPIQVTSLEKSFIQHNFQGFQKELYELDYQPPVSDDLTQQVAALLDEEFEITLNNDYGIDHGIWMPLRMLRPEADLPVVQISLPMLDEPRQVLKLGHALSTLRENGILVLGSGAAALNTSKIVWYARNEDVHPKTLEFDNWLEENLLTANIENILDFRKSAPHSEFASPSSANLLPLIFIMGTSIAGDKLQIIHKGYKYGTASLLSFCLTDELIPEGVLS